VRFNVDLKINGKTMHLTPGRTSAWHLSMNRKMDLDKGKLALTPALSPEERGKRSQCFAAATRSGLRFFALALKAAIFPRGVDDVLRFLGLGCMVAGWKGLAAGQNA
jgi:hypothetical protein